MYDIIVQRVDKKTAAPSTPQIKKWAKEILKNKTAVAELTIRIVDITEMTHLNTTYRHKIGPTNVLSFPDDIQENCLGDIVICAKIVNQEAHEQQKSEAAHWAHMITHGILHLLGYDHEIEADAIIMESEENHILNSLNFKNPYHSEKIKT